MILLLTVYCVFKRFFELYVVILLSCKNPGTEAGGLGTVFLSPLKDNLHYFFGFVRGGRFLKK